MSDNKDFVAYIIHQHPSLRTTFIRREIDALRAMGLRVEVFSLRPCDVASLKGDAEALDHMEHTHYLPAHPLATAYVWATLRESFRSPRKVLRNLSLALEPGAGSVSRWQHGFHVWRATWLAQRLRTMGNCRHLHAHFSGSSTTTALAAARLLGVGFSFTSHTSMDPTPLVRLKEAQFVASISEYDRQRLLEAVPAEEREEIHQKIHIIHCGIPLAQWPFTPRNWNRISNTAIPTILSVGAVEEKKGHDILLQACRLLRDQGVRFRCRIVGGYAGMDLRPLVKELDLQDTVTLLGALPQEAVKEELLNCDIFTLACRRTSTGNSDGIPVALMEPMAIGRPVVSTRIAGVPELVIDGQTGFLAEPGDPVSLAEKLRSVMQDSTRLDEILRRARQHIEKYFDADQEVVKLVSYLPMAKNQAAMIHASTM
ncbi:MAG: glycosyltransferase [Anaerolineae bacterium]|nr:glycosyltransferase [Anaerolineae bacterium]